MNPQKEEVKDGSYFVRLAKETRTKSFETRYQAMIPRMEEAVAKGVQFQEALPNPYYQEFLSFLQHKKRLDATVVEEETQYVLIINFTKEYKTPRGSQDNNDNDNGWGRM